jgi:tellurite resistance protein TerA
MPIDYSKDRGPQGGGVSLSKVTLTKNAPTVSLSKQQGGSARGELRINLNWNSRPSSGGLFKRQAAGGIDLDLACLYELTNGRKGVVQALGDSFTSRNDGQPIISLDGDDRTGESTEGENMQIDLARLGEIPRILVFTDIYEGTPNWAGAKRDLDPVEPRETELIDRGTRIVVSAAVGRQGVAQQTGMDNRNAADSVRREVRYIYGTQSALDAAYGWGMTWTKGRK